MTIPNHGRNPAVKGQLAAEAYTTDTIKRESILLFLSPELRIAQFIRLSPKQVHITAWLKSISAVILLQTLFGLYSDANYRIAIGYNTANKLTVSLLF